MVINKILNNNMVISQNQQGKETILKGKGIGFKKKPGDLVDTELIERIFVPGDKKEAQHYQQLLSTIPQEYWDLSEQIVAYAHDTCDITVSENIILSLCDHMAGAVERYKNHMVLKNPMLWDIKRLYPKEFQVGKHGIKLIDKCLHVEMEEDEAAFFAYHFVYSQLSGSGIKDLEALTHLIDEILHIVESSFHMKLDTASWEYQRFLTHLKFFVQRILMNNQHGDKEDGLFGIIRDRYPESYVCSGAIANYIRVHNHYELNHEEMLYLMIHIEKVTKTA